MPTIRPCLLLALATVLGCDTAPESEAAPLAASDHASVARSSGESRRSVPAVASGVGDSAARAAAPGSMDALTDGLRRDGRTSRDGGRFDRARQSPATDPGQLTAGKWSDRDDWTRWQGLLDYGSPYASILAPWGMRDDARVAVTLQGVDHTPVDAELVLKDARGITTWTARTDNAGRAELFLPRDQTATLSAHDANGEVLASRQVGGNEEHQLRLPRDVGVASALDLMFVVDTTGSMGDELSFLKAELSDIVARAQGGADHAFQIRTSVNFFRDDGDQYVVRGYPFTADLGESLRRLQPERAAGGGDTPEALHDALADAVHNHDWSPSAVARLMFVVTDAPPHQGSIVGQSLRQSIAAAAANGIRIIPIASSGVDKASEFVLRQMAVSTGGTYVFLTDHSGIGNAHIAPTVGPHTVAPLNDLIVEVIDGYTRSGTTLRVAPEPAQPQDRYPVAATAAPRGWFSSHDPWWYALLGLAFVAPFGVGAAWRRFARRAPSLPTDPRIVRARRLVDELARLAKTRAGEEAHTWSTDVAEVADGLEELARQRQAIDASLRSAGAPLQDTEADGLRGSLAAEVARRRQAIDAEIDAGLLSIESAYLHVIGGVGHRTTAQANLDAAREALHSRLEIERELRTQG